MTSSTTSPAETSAAGVRLDIWLWAARFFKTRSLAKAAIAAGRIEVNGQRAKPSRAVHANDQLLVHRGDEQFQVQVRGLADQRGPAPVAQALYEESAQSRQRREEQRALRAAERTGYRAPETKPDKRARRLIQALGDIDAL
ncbi:RNA-binding S4 domain-containing protein [Pseudoxanthomonas composti]|uniref:Heat shock protein 15 n=1 Tax=Pseudoxanthomonas composti TaxID=2137479 RepID=A0A4Q1JYS9_9GAMM|nr:S4 domain-containing protein [Pseudoxanthomonas composti]RXR08307.1 RNA-binding protein [Pseudoxanthomonas composti]